MNNITLYDLMAEDLEVWISRNPKFGFDLQIDNEKGVSIVNEKGVHRCACDSFADFCRQYLRAYDKASLSEVA